MKKLLLLLFLPITLHTVEAQSSPLKAQEALKKLGNKIDRSNRDKRNPDYSKSFEKTPLVFRDWYYGKLLFSDNTAMDSIRFNFDVDVNSVVVQFGMDISAVSLKPDVVESFLLYDQGHERQFIRKIKADFKDIKYHMPFFEVVLGEDGGDKLTILKQYQKTQVSEDNQGSYKPVGFKADGTQIVYNFRVTYFSKRAEDSTYQKFGLSKKKILGLFDKAKGKEVLGYVRSNGLKWSDEPAMMQVIEKFFE
ncbi:MAG: hypothetical protein HEP71_34685 [Roseivirga sp.]|nr:hypothetical protein [Roseivirga sp.]